MIEKQDKLRYTGTLADEVFRAGQAARSSSRFGRAEMAFKAGAIRRTWNPR
jgi:hypothetical protein